ncbi:Z1 domain-containing protein [Georgenia sp. SYP-B2076]|uniref:Z1 domain-containing protein n=1 Tax=Georgenia sp. SYP-B2076 TaxID=2495881 RepID=UPI000F8DA80A|nr:Z1 domain-containing protein [Georgenia sp. SYP-B2076]
MEMSELSEGHFVSAPRTERVHLAPVDGVGANVGSWWDGYREALDASSMSETSKTVIQTDSKYILRMGVLGTGPAGDASWPASRVRRGLVMGSIQSGKTASMLGVSALSLDEGVDAVVVLAGTRVSLWKQTFERLRTQLDSHGADLDRERRRLLLPSPSAVLDDGGDDVPLSRLYAFNGQQARRALRQRRPLIAVVMKNVHHLQALAETLHRQLIPAINSAARPFHLVVLDDEADDGSILDARAESGLDPAFADLKQVPRSIVDLWETRPHDGTSASPNLYVTYIAYTATPQANFLQADYNPLAPKDFVVSLRTPFDQGGVEPRSTTFREPGGLRSFYTGGEVFYRRVKEAPLCLATDGQPDVGIAESVRAFLVAGAIRLWRDDGRLLPSVARSTYFASRQEAAARSPLPHSMLFHPSAAIQDHFDAAAGILAWAGGLDRDQAVARLDAGDRSLPVDALSAMVLQDEEPWAAWLDHYRRSAQAVRGAFDLPHEPVVPDRSMWPAVRDLLLHEVIPATRLSIVNSDPRADDRPAFEPQEDDGTWLAPCDLSTIFISGNVMSRGLTLEGLTTTLFLRHSDDPYADTQMQMQRWFGYRGPHLELCRVFLPSEQLDLFRAYHESDEALRRDVVKLMNEQLGEAPDPRVLQGRDFIATGKLTNVSNVPLSPGAAPFVRLMNDGKNEDPNTRLLAVAFANRASHDVVVNDRPRGRILDEPLSLSEAAELLDGLRYDNYRPGREGWQASRWAALEAHIGLDAASDGERLLPLYRPPEPDEGEPASEVRSDCPYGLGAYLRLWHASLSRHARGLVATDDPRTPWSMVDLSKKQSEQPKFYIGIRYGSGSTITEGLLGELPFDVRPMMRDVVDGQLAATWGSRNPGSGSDPYLGDSFFDYHAHEQVPPKFTAGEAPWRPAGAPGLILFHVIERGEGLHPTTALGLAVPLGGPDQFAARGPR